MKYNQIARDVIMWGNPHCNTEEVSPTYEMDTSGKDILSSSVMTGDYGDKTRVACGLFFELPMVSLAMMVILNM